MSKMDMFTHLMTVGNESPVLVAATWSLDATRNLPSPKFTVNQFLPCFLGAVVILQNSMDTRRLLTKIALLTKLLNNIMTNMKKIKIHLTMTKTMHLFMRVNHVIVILITKIIDLPSSNSRH